MAKQAKQAKRREVVVERPGEFRPADWRAEVGRLSGGVPTVQLYAKAGAVWTVADHDAALDEVAMAVGATKLGRATCVVSSALTAEEIATKVRELGISVP